MKLNYGNGIKTIAFTLCMIMITSPVLSSASLSFEKGNSGDRIGQSITPIEKTVIEPKGIPVTPDDRSLTLTYQVNPDDITFQEQTIDGTSYQKISLQDYPLTTEAGKPQLPFISKLLAIPDHGEPQVEIISSDYTVLSDVNVCPVPQPQILSSSKEQGSTENEFTIDNTVYSANQLYPEKLADLSPGSYLRGQRIARLTINPLQWNPVTKELRVYTTITIKIVFSEKLVCKDVGPYSDMCSQLVSNYIVSSRSSESLKKDVSPLSGTVSYPDDPSVHGISADYLIITSDEFYIPAKQDHDAGTVYDPLNALAHWRAEYDGFDVAVVSVNHSFIGVSPGDTQDSASQKIRFFIQYVLNNWNAPHMNDHHVGYILLVGATPFVATHELVSTVPDAGVSDQWYGCFHVDAQTGLFVEDGDHSTPDISVGRFSVNTASELQVIAEKTINYEQNYVYTGDENTRWHTHVLFGRGSMDMFGWYREVINSFLLPNGWNVSEVNVSDPDHFNATIANINEGRSIIVYCGHGDYSGWEITDYGFDMDQLHNGVKLPLVYSLSCWTGAFQCESPCLGETLLNTQNKGAIAFWGASTPTYVGIFDFGQYLFSSLFDNLNPLVGDIITEGILKMANQEQGWHYPEFNLLGDPALDITGAKGRIHQNIPDLTISKQDITFNPLEPIVNETTVITTTVHNIGGIAAYNVTVRYLLISQNGEQQTLATITLPGAIPSGGEQTVEYSWIPQTTGKNTIFVQVDPENTLLESCEWNNQAGTLCTVFAGAVFVDDDYTPSTPGWGVTHFASICLAITAVAEHGVINVYNGTYHTQDGKQHLSIQKSIALIGENAATTIIHWNGGLLLDPAMIRITAQGASISGFTIEGGKEGINVSTDDVVISGNIFRNLTSGVGIRLSSAERVTIINNWFDSSGILLGKDPPEASTPTIDEWTSHVIEGNSVQGRPIYYLKNTDGTNLEIPADAAQIILANCTHFTLHDQIFSGIAGGIQLGFSSNNTITNNIFLAINGDALIFAIASNNLISENTIQNIGNGITLQYSSDYNTITKNIVTTCTGTGLSLSNSKHNLISENTIQDTNNGITIRVNSSSNTLIKNIIRACIGDGITLSNSDNNRISNNVISNAIGNGLSLSASSENTITYNTFSDNRGYGILLMSDSNRIYHNNFIDNTCQASDTGINFWDNGYPSGGNYWNDCIGNDNFHGPNQNISGGDGIVDAPYPIPDGNSKDLYPLMHQFILGDVNNDGSVLYADVDPFVEALGITQETFQIHRPLWSWLAADCNHDGMITFADIDPFVDLLLSPPPSNHPPTAPNPSSPPNHASDVSITADLSWIGSDPDAGDTVTYDVYFGTTNPPPRIATGQTSSIYDPGTLQYSTYYYTYYYWRVVAWDNHGVPTTSPIWDFFTEEGPNHSPYEPSNPSPPNNATGVFTCTVLSWTCYGDPDPLDSVTYDVYFGTSSSPPRVVTGQTSTTYNPGTPLLYYTKYYWKIVAIDNHGASTSSILWDFRTEFNGVLGIT